MLRGAIADEGTDTDIDIDAKTKDHVNTIGTQVQWWSVYSYSKICQQTVSQEKTSRGQGCKTDRSTLEPSILASVKVNYWKIAVGQGVEVPSPGIPGLIVPVEQ